MDWHVDVVAIYFLQTSSLFLLTCDMCNHVWSSHFILFFHSQFGCHQLKKSFHQVLWVERWGILATLDCWCLSLWWPTHSILISDQRLLWVNKKTCFFYFTKRNHVSSVLLDLSTYHVKLGEPFQGAVSTSLESPVKTWCLYVQPCNNTGVAMNLHIMSL